MPLTNTKNGCRLNFAQMTGTASSHKSIILWLSHFLHVAECLTQSIIGNFIISAVIEDDFSP